MTLSLDSIYQPFNDFFPKKFGAQAGAPVKFYFAHIPQSFTENDFLIPAHQDWGPSAALAQEIFSSVVDGIPVVDAQANSVWMGPHLISELYSDELLGPALPSGADTGSDAEHQAIADSFDAIKSDAETLFEKIKAASLLGAAGGQYRPSNAMPATWWDATSAGVWTSQVFQIKGAAGPATTDPGPPNNQLLRLRLDDFRMGAVIKSTLTPSAQNAPQTGTASRLVSPYLTLKPATVVAAKSIIGDKALINSSAVAEARVSPATDSAPPINNAPLRIDLDRRITVLPFDQRYELQSVLAQSATTQPVVANDITIGFDFCAVNVARPWLQNAFLDNKSWYIPGQAKGALSANDGYGLTAMPVGFVAIKNLSIRAAWTAEDISRLQQSVQFGPFNFDSTVIDGAISHVGIQIIGWMLQDLPAFPPNAA